jgi:hypothetical protein
MTLFEVVRDDVCVPFSYASESSSTGSRIGGNPPRNAVSTFDRKFQKYFGTIEFDGGSAVSIFYSFDIYGNDEQRDIISYNNQPLYPSELIHAVIHESGAATEDSDISAEVSCHRIVFDQSRSDIAEQDGNVPYTHSKIGGTPFVDNVSRVGQAFEQLLKLGFKQLIQFGTPNPRTHGFVNGFPWDPGWLNVLVRGTNFDNCDFAFVIQQ